jgi:hypothetical protein
VDYVQAAVERHACGNGISNAENDFSQVAEGRLLLLQRLADLSLSQVPDGQQVSSDLRRSWLISERIDKDFQNWAEAEAARNCQVGDARVASYVATESLDPQSTNIKTTFVNLWNRIAAPLGVPANWTASQI